MTSAPDPPPSHAPTREQSRAATRSALLESAESQFLANGYRGTSLGEIATSAGYSKGAIYSNFSSKDELFLSVSAHRSERAAQPLLDALSAPGDADSKLDVFAQWLADITKIDNEWILVETEFKLVERRNPAIAAVLKNRYRQTVRDVSDVLHQQLDILAMTPVVDVSIVAETLIALESGLALSHSVDPNVGSKHLIDVFRALIGHDAP